MENDFLSDDEWEEIISKIHFRHIPSQYIISCRIVMTDGSVVVLDSNSYDKFIETIDLDEVFEVKMAINLVKMREHIIVKTDDILNKSFPEEKRKKGNVRLKKKD